MTDRAWIEMPVVPNETGDGWARPKYPIESSATLIHRDGKVYVAFEDETARQEAAQQPDCRLLTSTEGRELEDSFPFPIASPGQQHVDENQPVGLGDAVAWLASRVGIEECGPCQKRKRWLNRLIIWGWWRRPSS